MYVNNVYIYIYIHVLWIYIYIYRDTGSYTYIYIYVYDRYIYMLYVHIYIYIYMLSVIWYMLYIHIYALHVYIYIYGIVGLGHGHSLADHVCKNHVMRSWNRVEMSYFAIELHKSSWEHQQFFTEAFFFFMLVGLDLRFCFLASLFFHSSHRLHDVRPRDTGTDGCIESYLSWSSGCQTCFLFTITNKQSKIDR